MTEQQGQQAQSGDSKPPEMPEGDDPRSGQEMRSLLGSSGPKERKGPSNPKKR